jgi:hypothetical protein
VFYFQKAVVFILQPSFCATPENHSQAPEAYCLISEGVMAIALECRLLTTTSCHKPFWNAIIMRLLIFALPFD